MKQQLLLVLSLLILIGVLILVNTLSYTQQPKLPDSESRPNRSTFNAGATGSRALFDLLNETGRKAERWQQSMSFLSSMNVADSTFVIVGSTRIKIEPDEVKTILAWVQNGGRLVVIDRDPDPTFLSTKTNWVIGNDVTDEFPDVDPTNQAQMTAATPAGKAVQPSIYNAQINAVQPSRFASSINFRYDAEKVFPEATVISTNPKIVAEDRSEIRALPPPPKVVPTSVPVSTPANTAPTAKPQITPIFDLPPTPKPTAMPVIETPEEAQRSNEFNAPFLHISNGTQNIVVDFPYGAGEIVVISDPYIVSNAGIGIVDNSQLALNILGSRKGRIFFNEYHHGYGGNRGNIFAYFAGTPVIAIGIQILLLIGVFFWSQSRRFARPVPVPETDRLSKLEYVGAMAELQQRTKAYDLALENIFSEFKRSATKLLGLDGLNTSPKDLAKAVAERVGDNEMEIYHLLADCQDIIHGEPTNRKQVLELTQRLRELEAKLGVKRSRKQAFRR